MSSEWMSSEECYDKLYDIASEFCVDERITENELEDFLDFIQGAAPDQLRDCLDDYNETTENEWLEMWVLN